MSSTTATPGVEAPIELGHPTRALALFGIVPLLLLMIFVVGLANGVRGDHVTMLALALFTTFVGTLPLILDQARPPTRRHLVLTIFCLAYVAHFVLPVFTHYLYTSNPTDPPGVAGGNLLPHHVVSGQWVALAGLLALLAGYALTPARLTPTQIAQREAREWPVMATLGLAIVIMPVGWAIVVAGAMGLIPSSAGTGVLSTLGSSIIYGNALLTVAAVRHRSKLAWILLLVAVPVSSLLGFFTGSKRSVLIFPAAVVLTIMLLHGRIRSRWLVAGAVALIVLYPLAQFQRDIVLQGNTLSAADALKNREATFRALSWFLAGSDSAGYLSEGLQATAGRLDGLGIESVIVRDTPTVSPYQYGSTLGLIFVAFVPRLFWPSKPSIGIGQWITDTYGSGPHITSNTGPTWIGDFYLNFGVAGVVAMMLLCGAIFRLFQARALGPAATTAGLMAGVVLLVRVCTTIVASFAQVVAGTILALAPILFAHFLVTRLLGRPARVEPQALGARSGV